MIRLHQFAPAWEVRNLSPFCLKVETVLRMAGLEYEVVHDVPVKAPKGQLPFIEDDHRRISDSRFIIEYLEATYGNRVDGHLTREERAVARGMEALVESHLDWVFVYARFGGSDSNWQENSRALFGGLPPVVRQLVPPYARRRMRNALWFQGMGRHTEDEIYHLGRRDLDTLSDFLGENPWFLGERPCTLDASAYGMLANILWCPIESPLKDHLEHRENLVAFCERVRRRYYASPET